MGKEKFVTDETVGPTLQPHPQQIHPIRSQRLLRLCHGILPPIHKKNIPNPATSENYQPTRSQIVWNINRIPLDFQNWMVNVPEPLGNQNNTFFSSSGVILYKFAGKKGWINTSPSPLIFLPSVPPQPTTYSQLTTNQLFFPFSPSFFWVPRSP